MTYRLTEPIPGHKIMQDRAHGPRDEAPHNDFGSRSPVIEDDPDWSGFTLPEGLRITPRT